MIESNQREIRELTKFGLTLTQASIYCVLVRLGEANAKTISNLTKIARQDVYRVLDELFEKGLIEKKISNPIKYKAISMKKCLSLLLNIRRRKTLELQESAKVLEKLYAPLQQGSEQTSAKLTLVHNGEQILFKSHELLCSAQKTIHVISPAKNLFPWLIDQQEQFYQALKRRVKINLITNNIKNQEYLKLANSLFRKNLNLKIRYLAKSPTISCGIYDNKKIIFELSSTNAYTKSEVIITDNPCLIEWARSYFKTMWLRGFTL